MTEKYPHLTKAAKATEITAAVRAMDGLVQALHVLDHKTLALLLFDLHQRKATSLEVVEAALANEDIETAKANITDCIALHALTGAGEMLARIVAAAPRHLRTDQTLDGWKEAAQMLRSDFEKQANSLAPTYKLMDMMLSLEDRGTAVPV